jgi:uncharacterized protein YqeY
MSLRTRFQENLKQAMHARDEIVVGTLRLITAAMKDRDIAARAKGNWDGITEDEILGMLQSMIKQRQESIKMYEAGRRQDLVDRELAEIRVIETFLPKQLSDDEMKAAISAAIKEVGAGGIKDMGKVMADLKTRYAGQMDFGRASGMVKERLVG